MGRAPGKKQIQGGTGQHLDCSPGAGIVHFLSSCTGMEENFLSWRFYERKKTDSTQQETTILHALDRRLLRLHRCIWGGGERERTARRMTITLGGEDKKHMESPVGMWR